MFPHACLLPHQSKLPNTRIKYNIHISLSQNKEKEKDKKKRKKFNSIEFLAKVRVIFCSIVYYLYDIKMNYAFSLYLYQLGSESRSNLCSERKNLVSGILLVREHALAS